MTSKPASNSNAASLSVYCVFHKQIPSEHTDNPYQIVTAYLVEDNRCDPLTALDPFCINVKEQSYQKGAGRDGGQIISTVEPAGLQVSPGQGELSEWRK